MQHLPADQNFLGIEEEAYCQYSTAKYVIQSAPYEHTSSYKSGSDRGPEAIIIASQFVELYDETLDLEPYKAGIATLPAIDFKGSTNAAAVDIIAEETKKLIDDNKFVVSLGAEHTVTLGFVKGHLPKYPNLTLLQIDAHSDLRASYHDNPYSHASVMARIHDLNVPLTQVGIRAQCKEESDLMKSSDNIHTFYAHAIRTNPNWIADVVNSLGTDVYITIDADGFDPSVIPSVGTAEPGGMLWYETLEMLRAVINAKNVVGFDIVEVMPTPENILSEYACAQLAYRIIGYLEAKK